jgi:hypothetical protein
MPGITLASKEHREVSFFLNRYAIPLNELPSSDLVAGNKHMKYAILPM